MRLLIAEKPSVARDIGQVVGANQRRDGYLEGPGWLVTWCIGHLVELVEPHEYNPDWKRWSLATLPMLPREFQLRPVASTRAQFKIVKGLLCSSRVQEVINGCDAGREGELIFRYAYLLAGAKLPVLRLWVSSMTDQAIRDGIASLRPASDYDRLFAAARSRSEADWLVGLNATRAITVRSRQGRPFDKNAPLYSIGRVQTPTLALMVDREREILHFRPEDYWQLQADLSSPRGDYEGRWFKPDPADSAKIIDRFGSKNEALMVRETVLGKTGQITEVDQKRVKEPPPLLFDLTRLQRTANKRYGFSASRTLQIAQALYEQQKVLTYPRTDSRHLSSDLVPKLDRIIGAVAIGPYRPFAEQLLALEKLPISKRIVDDKKVSDHHAIIPTSNRPQLDRLTPDEAKIYDMVVRRFLGIFFPHAEFDKTKVVTEVAAELFISRGKVLIDPGWREVAGFVEDEGGGGTRAEAEEEDEATAGVLPPLQKGDPATATDVELLEKQTQPPPRFTEATLLAAMEGAGRLIDEEELQQAMKDRGLGTPATRAGIIETLLHRQYLVRKGKTLLPTERGIRLIDAVPVEGLRSPHLTGEWEARLSRMARGEYPAERFMAEVREYVQDVVDRIKRAPPIQWSTAEPESDPRLDGRVRRGQSDGDAADPDPTLEGQGAPAKKHKKKAKPASGASSPREHSVPSGRNSSGEKNPGVNDPVIGECPRCSGPVTEDKEFYRCSATGCGFALKKTIAGKKLTPSIARTLLSSGRTRTLKGFVSPRSGVSFSASLFLKAEGGVGFEFKNRPESPSGNTTQTAIGTEREAAHGGPLPRERTETTKGTDRGKSVDKKTTSVGEDASSGGKRTWPAIPAAINLEEGLGRCPLCNLGQVIPGRRAWGCSRWKAGCRFLLPFSVGGLTLTETQAQTLIRGGIISPVAHLVDSQGRPFPGHIQLILEPENNRSDLLVTPASTSQ